MKRVVLSGLLSLCVALAMEAQEIKDDKSLTMPDNAATELPADFRQDMIRMQWDNVIGANIMNTLRDQNYSNALSGMTDTGHSYTLFSRQTVLPGLMTIRDAGGSMDFRLSDRFNLTVGSYALKYQSNFGNVYNDGVAFMSAGYELLPWLTVGAYGQYSIFSGYNAQNGSLLLSPLVPATSFGTYGIVMFNEYIGVQGWAGKEFNPFTGKWKPVYGAAPVINFNALFK